MLADCLTLSRIPASLLLLLISPYSRAFWAVYLFCGVTDALDGFAARRLHTESARGARLDSAADLVFAAVYAVKILPLLSLPAWLWIWIALIAILKIAAMTAAGTIAHSFANKLTGMLVFLLPLSLPFAASTYGAALTCAAASLTLIVEIMADMKKKIR